MHLRHAQPRVARQRKRTCRLLLALALLCVPQLSLAGDGRLLATGGATQIEGTAGGGIVPWAVLSGYGTDTQNGLTAYATRVQTGDYAVDAYGAAFVLRNRVEFSYARQTLELDELRDRLSLPTGQFHQDVFGVKIRLVGDVVYSSVPQISIGVQRKHQLDFAIPRAIGATSDQGTDVYIAATKLFLAGASGHHLLLNGTLRSTNANQAGLLGFGGDRKHVRSLVFETSAAVMLNPRWGVGVEYRQKPDNLGFAKEDDWKDAFVAWFPNKHLSVVGAYADLGSIATLRGQRGAYLSIQASY